MTTAATRASDQVAAFERAQQFIGGGTVSAMRRDLPPTPLSLVEGHGSHVTDEVGNDYIDYVCGWGPVILGHTHPSVTQAVVAQVWKGQSLGAMSPIETEAARAVLDTLGWAERLLFSNTGTEAVQVALRLARGVTGRTKIVKMAGAYHGWHDTVLLSHTTPPEGSRPTLGSRGQLPGSADEVLVTEYGDLDSLRNLLQLHGPDVAAVLSDPVMSNSGLLTPPPGYLAEVKNLAHRHGALLVFDEVVTGFRIARGGAYEVYGVAPDLATYAKAVANGYPVSAVAGRADIIDQVTSGIVHSGTYNAHATAAAAILATQQELAAPGLHHDLSTRARHLADGRTDILVDRRTGWRAHSQGAFVQVMPEVTTRHSGMWFHQADWSRWNAWAAQLVEDGLFLLTHGRMFLSAAHTDADVDHTLAAFAAADLY
ncbi:glutamate-1-semialdehyde aminotransferase [Prauserella sp. Am3]|nr:glutamate-1-semialdehyde aminotransferase [Prauserella sp. Am3]